VSNPSLSQLNFFHQSRIYHYPIINSFQRDEPMDDLSGQVIRGYEILERVGAGGFGVVYRAFQLSVRREVAFKAILPQRAEREEFIRRFETEAHLVARLEHPHIVPLYDFWREPDGNIYLVMRWLRGGSLRDLLRHGPLPF
jgi:serine/threonine protein kinase